MIRSRSLKRSRGIGAAWSRRLGFESLESRQLLSITLPSIDNVTLPAGTAVYVPLNGSDPGHTIDYSVTASDYTKLTAVMTPQANKSLQLTVRISDTVYETMSFRLFDDLAPTTTATIEALVQSGFYNGLSIYRNGKDGSGNPFVIQGGNNPPTGNIKTNQSSIAEEFDPNLQYTSAGLLAMARSASPGTSSTEFFITEETTRSLDYNYTIFGVMTSGFDVLDTIAAMENQDSTDDPNGLGYLETPLTITSASIVTDTQNGVLELRAPKGVTGTFTVTVTASDGTNSPVTRSFAVTIQADSASSPANPFASVIPTAPSSVTFLPPTGSSSQHTDLDNSDSSHTLQFQVTGVTSGNVVQILADGNVIGQKTASDTTVVVTTDGSTALSNGWHQITAIQIAPDKTVSVAESAGNNTTQALSKTADVPSFNSTAIKLSVGNASLSGHVYLDSNNDGQKSASESAMAGASVKLTAEDGSVSWTQTDSVGSYVFQHLAGGNYGIQVFASSQVSVGQNTLGTVDGAPRGTVGQGSFQVAMEAGETGSGYNFAIVGLQPQHLSLRLLLASSGPMTQSILNLHVAPTVSLTAAGTSYSAGGAAVAVISSASISSPDSATLTSVTVTIQNRPDGNAEQLQAVTSGTPITSAYANGVLTLSGVASPATYQTVLQSITYQNTAPSATLTARTISVVVNDGTRASAAATTSLTIKQAATTTTLASSVNPSTYGASTTLTATVSAASGGTPTGTVTFKDGDTVLGTASLANGTASLVTSSLIGGSHSIQAVYGGDGDFVASTSSAVTQNVTPVATTTTLASSPNPSSYGTPVTFAAAVSSSVGTPGGSVTFKDGDTVLGTANLANGTANLTVPALSAGSHNITAVYAGNASFVTSTSSVLPQSIAQAATSTTMTSSASSSSYGAAVTFTATVASSSGTPIGTVTFMDGNTVLGTGTITNGTASFATSALAVGSHNITAVYDGNANFLTSTSAVHAQTVEQAVTTTAVVSSANPAGSGTEVTLTVTVSSTGGTPTGTVTIKDGDTELVSMPIINGTATLTSSQLTVGDHSITVLYSGDISFASSISTVLTQTINVGV